MAEIDHSGMATVHPGRPADMRTALFCRVQNSLGRPWRSPSATVMAPTGVERWCWEGDYCRGMGCRGDQFDPGEIVYLRHLQRDQIGLLFPLQIVEDRADSVLLWAPAGAQGWHFAMPDGRTPDRTPLPEWMAARRVPVAHTVTHGALIWDPPGLDYSVRWFFRADGEFLGWYANLEAPSIRWRDAGIAGIDTVDWDLDVVVDRDREWRWKDEDEFAERLRVPDAYWVDDEDRVRMAGRQIIELVEAGEFPFDGTWCDFRPTREWPSFSPDLPSGWDRPLSVWPDQD